MCTAKEVRGRTVSIRQDDVGALSSQLQSDFLQVAAAWSLLDQMTHLTDRRKGRAIFNTATYDVSIKIHQACGLKHTLSILQKEITQHFSRFLIKMQNFSFGCLLTHSDPCSSAIISKGDFFWLSCVTLTYESFKNKKRHLTLFSFLLLDSTNLTKTCIHSTDPGLCT